MKGPLQGVPEWKGIPLGIHGVSPYSPIECLYQAWLFVDEGDLETARTWWESGQAVLALVAAKGGHNG